MIDLDELTTQAYDLCQEIIECIRKNQPDDRYLSLCSARELSLEDQDVLGSLVNHPFSQSLLSIEWQNNIHSFEFENKCIESIMPQVLMMLSSDSPLGLSLCTKAFKRAWFNNEHTFTDEFLKSILVCSETIESGSTEDLANLLKKGTWCSPFWVFGYDVGLMELDEFFGVLKEDYQAQIKACENACQNATLQHQTTSAPSFKKSKP